MIEADIQDALLDDSRIQPRDPLTATTSPKDKSPFVNQDSAVCWLWPLCIWILASFSLVTHNGFWLVDFSSCVIPHWSKLQMLFLSGMKSWVWIFIIYLIGKSPNRCPRCHLWLRRDSPFLWGLPWPSDLLGIIIEDLPYICWSPWYAIWHIRRLYQAKKGASRFWCCKQVRYHLYHFVILLK